MSKLLYVIGLMSFICLVLAIKLITTRKNITVKLNRIDLIVLLFVGYVFVRILFTKHIPVFKSGFMLLVALTGAYFLFKEIIIKNQEDPQNLATYIIIGCFLLMGLLQAGYGLLQLYDLIPTSNPYFKMTGSFGNPDPYAGFLATVMSFTVSVHLLDEKNTIPKALKYLCICTLFSCLLILPTTYIRGAWLAVIAGVGFIVNYKYNLIKRIRRFINTTTKRVVCGIIGLSLLGSVGVGLYTLKPDSAYGRLFIWKVTSGIIADYPIFGMGFNQFQADYNNYQAAYFASGAGNEREKRVAGNVRQTHNEYLQVLAELGIVGFLLFGGIIHGLCLGYKQTVRAQKEEVGNDMSNIFAIAATASLLSISVLSLFSFPFQILPNALNGILLLALCSAFYDAKTQLSISFRKGRIVSAIVLIMLSLSGCYFAFTTFIQYKGWNKAVEASFVNTELNNKHVNSQFERLYPVLKDKGEFLFDYGSHYIRLDKHEKAIPLLEKAKTTFAGPHLYVLLGMAYQETGKFNKAEENLQHAAWMRPHKMHPRYLLVKLYTDAGNTPKALQTANQVLKMDEKKETTAAEEIKQEMRELVQTQTANHSKLKP